VNCPHPWIAAYLAVGFVAGFPITHHWRTIVDPPPNGVSAHGMPRRIAVHGLAMLFWPVFAGLQLLAIWGRS
jgi:hypothetical protein